MARRPPSFRSIALGFLLALPLALAGCIGDDALDPAGTAPPVVPAVPLPPTAGVVHKANGIVADLAPDAVRAVGGLFHIGLDAAEPTLGVDADGTIFMTALSPGGILAPTIARSTDKGATWEDVGPSFPTGHRNPPITFDPFVHVDAATGRVFTIDLQALACAHMSYSDDGGESWTTNPLACGHPYGMHDHHSISTAPPRILPTVGYDNLVYYCVNRVADSVCAVSATGGLTWGPLVPVYPGAKAGVPGDDPEEAFCGGLHGHVVGSADGRAYLPKAQCGVPSVAVTENDGATWTVVPIAPAHRSQGHEVAVATDEAGNVYAFWIGTDGLPYLSSSTDFARTWTAPLMVGSPGITAADYPTIAAGAEGRVAFAYVATDLEDGYEGRMRPCRLPDFPIGECVDPTKWDGAVWHAYLGVSTDALADEPTFTTVTVNDPADPIARGVCGRTRCLNSQGSGIYDFIDVVIDGEGRPWAALVDVCTQEGCIDDPEGRKDEAIGAVGTLVAGPALRGEAAGLPVLT